MEAVLPWLVSSDLNQTTYQTHVMAGQMGSGPEINGYQFCLQAGQWPRVLDKGNIRIAQTLQYIVVYLIKQDVGVMAHDTMQLETDGKLCAGISLI